MVYTLVLSHVLIEQDSTGTSVRGCDQPAAGFSTGSFFHKQASQAS